MRLIDGEQLEEIIYKYCCNPCRRQGCDRCRGCKANSILKLMKALCSIVEAKPVVHAHWEQIANGFMVCSHCEEPVEENRKYFFCPHCGAKMDEGEKIV